jgi:hypothetical protein
MRRLGALIVRFGPEEEGKSSLLGLIELGTDELEIEFTVAIVTKKSSTRS